MIIKQQLVLMVVEWEACDDGLKWLKRQPDGSTLMQIAEKLVNDEFVWYWWIEQQLLAYDCITPEVRALADHHRHIYTTVDEQSLMLDRLKYLHAVLPSLEPFFDMVFKEMFHESDLS